MQSNRSRYFRYLLMHFMFKSNFRYRCRVTIVMLCVHKVPRFGILIQIAFERDKLTICTCRCQKDSVSTYTMHTFTHSHFIIHVSQSAIVPIDTDVAFEQHFPRFEVN